MSGCAVGGGDATDARLLEGNDHAATFSTDPAAVPSSSSPLIIMSAEHTAHHQNTGWALSFPRGIPLAHPTKASPAVSRSPSPTSAHDILTLRALVTTKEAGVIIGKGGKNVADLREQTGVRAGVSKVIPGVHERVLTVGGSVDAIAKVRPLSIPPTLTQLYSQILCACRHTTSSSPSSSHQAHLLFPSLHHLRTPLSASLSLII